MTDLSNRLASGDTLYGTFLGLGSALAAEACALAGFDWLLTDLEHGGGDESELLPQQLAADAHGVPMLVRVESTHRIRAGHALDLGAAGIMFPGIESRGPGHAGHPTPPLPPDRGSRRRHLQPRLRLRPAPRTTRDRERARPRHRPDRKPTGRRTGRTRSPTVPGIHVLFIGPRDLSHDLGVPGDTSGPGVPGRAEARPVRRRRGRPRRRNPRTRRRDRAPIRRPGSALHRHRLGRDPAGPRRQTGRRPGPRPRCTARSAALIEVRGLLPCPPTRPRPGFTRPRW